jgi:transketolase
MGAISQAKLVLSGSHAGVSIGEDGPSQMALEDMASLRAIHGSVVVHPSDGNQTSQLVAALADHDGISFIRTLRGKTPVRTAPDEDVRIGGSRIAHEGSDVAIIACGITVDEAVKGPSGWPRAASTRGCSTPTRSSRSTRRPCRPPRGSAAAS